MFSFYGSKSKIINHYPRPNYLNIIEPFAGSARYSLRYFDHNVTLVDSDPVIVAVWKYLQQTTPQQILSLPDVPNGTVLETIEGFTQLCQEEKWLIGFCANGGSAVPKNVSGRHNFNSWNKDKQRIANNLFKIHHWKIFCGDYTLVGHEPATYFVDPPYIKGGRWYRYHAIDYGALGDWCRSLPGEAIVCEAGTADWLPFTVLRDIPFTHFKTAEDKRRKTTELVWFQMSER